MMNIVFPQISSPVRIPIVTIKVLRIGILGKYNVVTQFVVAFRFTPIHIWIPFTKRKHNDTFITYNLLTILDTGL